jgi:hypothetical protein
MWWDYNYYLAEKQIATMEGDIAICQEFSNYEQGQKSRGKDIDNLAIRMGQAIGSWMIKSSSNSEHAAIVTRGWNEGDHKGQICDANVGDTSDGRRFRGVAVRNWRPRPAYIYRCNVTALRNEASRIAKVIATRVSSGAKSGGRYDWDGAKKCVLKFKYVDAESAVFVDKCYDFAYNYDANKTLPGMFCSEFVVVCYMVAAKHEHSDLGNLDVDPRAISPKALQSLLERNGSFSRVGRPYNDR